MDIEHFSLLEAVEIAIDMEEEGIRFYGLAAEKLEDEDARLMFTRLREKEYEHINTFRRLYSDLSAQQGSADAALYLTDPEVESFFKAFVESAVFPAKGSAGAVAGKVQNVEDALRFGIQAEKDSILFYRELLSHDPYPEAAAALAGIIAEEKKHFQTLYGVWKSMTSGGAQQAS